MEKIKYLDGLRGLAAFIVVLGHYAVGFYPASYTARIEEVRADNAVDLLISGTPLNVFYGGNFAVTVFFILSGYVLSYKFFKYRDQEIIISSAVRRYFRLLIPVLFSSIIAYSFMKLSLFYNKEAATLTTSTWWLAAYWDFNPNFIDMLKQTFVGVFFFENQWLKIPT
ncbi:MAG: acyltransferase [Candidatus Methanoperedens sp.]|nr:acyltransferase [Candidatus Methanoperedens sp.]